MSKMTVGLGVLTAVLAVPAIALVTGCGGLRDRFRNAYDLTPLVEADTAGAPADAVSWRDGNDTVVSVWSEGQSRGQTIVLRGESSLDAVDVGLHRMTPEATLEDQATDFEIESCTGPSGDEPVCVQTDAQELDIVDLDNGLRRATYRAEVVRSDGTLEVVEGSFVFERPATH